MSLKVQKELEKLVKLVEGHPNGASIEELRRLTNEDVPKRTLQHRLSKLIQLGLIQRFGSSRSTKYYPKALKPAVPEIITTPPSLIPYSTDALEVKNLIQKPPELRHHVSYKREFLESYQPNKTYYLSEEIRQRLAKLGSGTDKGRPAGTYARQIYQRLLIDLSWNSSRLEGNTYSLLETEKLLDSGVAASGKDRMETQMILNHKEAIEFIVEMAKEIDINKYTILNIHALLSNNLLSDPKACGRLRTIPVKIGKSVYHPVEAPSLIEEYFQLIVQKASQIKNPFEQSFFLMVHLPYLQPFLDVNKRVSRLAGNIPFIRENLSPLSFVDVPESDYVQGLLAIYELNRIELFRDVFVWAYERSASLYLATLVAIGEPDPFRVKYRNLIREVILRVVREKKDKIEASHLIKNFAVTNIPEYDQNRFIELAEIEASSLHEGNFARFKIRLSEFLEWQKIWH